MRCPKCGYVQAQTEECVRCGKILTSYKPRFPKNEIAPGKAPGTGLSFTRTPLHSSPNVKDKKNQKVVWLNFFLPGAGYIYTGRKFFGISLLSIFLCSALGASLGIHSFLLIGFGMSVVGSVDSYWSVRKRNRALNGRSPYHFQAPKPPL